MRTDTLKKLLSNKIINVIIQELGYSSVKKLQMLGSGAFGVVYKLSDSLAIKFTTEITEYNLVKQLQEYNYKHLIKYYQAKKINYKGDQFYVVVMDLVTPLTKYLSLKTLFQELVYQTDEFDKETLKFHELIDICLDLESGKVYDIGEAYGLLLEYSKNNDKDAFELMKQLVDVRKDITALFDTSIIKNFDLHLHNYAVKDGIFVVLDQPAYNSYEGEDTEINLYEQK